MKTLKPYLIAFAMIFALASCKKKESSDDNAGGPSDAGNPCYGVSCQNGGVCLSGTCDCPEGFYGASCENQYNPVAAVITKVTLKNFPATDEFGDGWDPADGPDLIVNAAIGTSCGNTYTVGSPMENCVPGTEYSWDTDWMISTANFEKNWSFCVYDKDTEDANDYIKGFTLKPNTQSAGLPTTLEYAGNGTHIVFEIDWIFAE